MDVGAKLDVKFMPVSGGDVEIAKKLYVLLISLTRGAALTMVTKRGQSDFNGLECWRVLVKTYEPKVAAVKSGRRPAYKLVINRSSTGYRVSNSRISIA